MRPMWGDVSPTLLAPSHRHPRSVRCELISGRPRITAKSLLLLVLNLEIWYGHCCKLQCYERRRTKWEDLGSIVCWDFGKKFFVCFFACFLLCSILTGTKQMLKFLRRWYDDGRVMENVNWRQMPGRDGGRERATVPVNEILKVNEI